MGWTYTHKPPQMDTAEFLKDRLEQKYEPGVRAGYEILHGVLTPNALFAIMARKDELTSIEERFCMICLIDHRPNDHHNFGWKELTEEMGPAEIPPRDFFAALEFLIPENNHRYSIEWRQRCREYYGLDNQMSLDF